MAWPRSLLFETDSHSVVLTAGAPQYGRVEFRVLATKSGWNKEALQRVFASGQGVFLKAKLALKDESDTLNTLISLNISLQEWRREKASWPQTSQAPCLPLCLSANLDPKPQFSLSGKLLWQSSPLPVYLSSLAKKGGLTNRKGGTGKPNIHFSCLPVLLPDSCHPVPQPALSAPARADPLRWQRPLPGHGASISVGPPH